MHASSSVAPDAPWRVPAGAPEALIAGRVIALLVLAIVLLAPIGFVKHDELAVDHVEVVGDDAKVWFSQRVETFGELRRGRDSALLWALVIPIALATMIAEAFAYRRAIAGERLAGFGASAIRAAVVGGVAGAAAATTMRVAPHLALGGLLAVGAIVVLVAGAIAEAAACKQGRRGAIVPAD
jgi:hypothetical protein